MNFENLPESWRVVRLGRVVFKIKAGGTPSTRVKEYYENGDIPFVKIEDITNSGKYLWKTKTNITKSGLENSNAWIIPPNSILFAMYGSMGEIAINCVPVATNQAILGIIPNPKLIDLNYLYYFFKSLKGYWIKYQLETTQANLNAQIVKSFKIPLPPLSEQKRIVEILSLAEDLIKKQKEAIALIDKILMAKFLEMFGDPATNPKGWEVKPLSYFADFINGYHFGPKEWGTKGLPIIRIQNLNDVNASFNYFDGEMDNKYLVNNGDLLFSWSASLGVYIWNSGKAWLNQHIYKVLPKEGVTEKIFLFYLLKFFIPKFVSETHGSTMKHVTKRKLLNFQLPLPPIELQKHFAQIIEEFEKKRQEMQKTLEVLESLFKLLQKKAFTGELTAEWREQNKVEWEIPQLKERQAVLLASLYYHQNMIQKPAMITVAMKSAFLLQQDAGLNLGYNFIPYKYGPFSKEVYEDIEELEKNLLVERVKPKKDIEMTEIRLVYDFKDWTERIIDSLPEDIKETVKTYVEKYGKMKLNELLDYVYAKYPEYAVKSKRKRRRK